MFRRLAIATAAALVITGVSVAPAAASPPPDDGTDLMSVYTGTVDADGLAAIIDLGVDRHDIVATPVDGESGEVEVEVILSGEQAEQLAAAGAELEAKPAPESRMRTFGVQQTVFDRYLGDGGIKEELEQQAADNPTIAELVVIGQTVNGTDISAVRVTKNPAKAKDGQRPTTVFMGAQHAREWITPEMIRRLLDDVLAGYGNDDRITELVNTTEMWFIPVANPDGYDFTFEPGNRLWRKNLADNNGDGEITPGDGVDLNRNFPTRWGYDNEGSSPNPASETYRGTGPASEPETQALDELFAAITPEFIVNYHSAAELLLHGIGWQVATPSPDDVIYEAMVGDDEHPAVPGYDPDISAELYTTNGDTDSHMQEAYGTLGFTPEMATCQSASASDPDDQWEPSDCQSVFNFPDDEELIQAEYLKNIPFALAVAESALDPDDPVSVVDRDAADFVVDSFEVSYGDPQPVAVTAKRALKAKKLFYSINGGEPVEAQIAEWEGGERYGFENVDYYAEYRGLVEGASPGDSVEVWFTGTATAKDVGPGNAGPVESEHFTYELAEDSGSPVLVVANEDYTGVNPTYPAGTTEPKYLDEHVAALEANGVTPATWDVDAQGVPHHLGVLSHFDAALWYLGDNRLTQDPEDELIRYGGSQLPDLAVAERQQYLTIAMRDYLNEGGKLAYAGETTGYYGIGGDLFGGIYYGLDGYPDQECAVTADPFADCLLLADDFTQYWMGAYSRADVGAEDGTEGTAPPLDGVSVDFGGPATTDNPIDEAGSFVVTSNQLPVDEFPQFASEGVAEYPDPFGAVEGEWAAAAGHVDDGYQRLGRTFDLTGYAAGDSPRFEAQIAYDLEPGYDSVIVEARTAGSEQWTTLADANLNTSTAVPTECEAGFLLDLHPWLLNYLTPGDPCSPTGDTGDWNALYGSSGGWIPVSFDLSAYAGQEVEVVVSYVTDPASGGLGVIIDDTKLVTTAGESETEGFEDGLGAWEVLGAPEGSPANFSDWERSDGLAELASVVATEDTLLFGFGLEQLATDEERAEVAGRILAHFGG
ncbi:M14 family zinc carboxypeptidase [Agromyces sp. ZXT2-6]|uniref:M14 family zinc carboxypeptidase n=1 Tax=Agromyces sp. ZXT2-6 TaxID=3461153 RepID=UPI004054F488